MVNPGRLKIYENGEWRYVGYGPASSVATDLSDVTIDVAKNWAGYGISNLGVIAPNGANATDIGTTSNEWRHVYIGGTIYLGIDQGVNLYNSSGSLKTDSAFQCGQATISTINCAVLATGTVSASDTLQASNDSQKSTISTSYVKLKSMLLNASINGTVRLKVDAYNANGWPSAYVKFYKNGAAIGAEYTHSGKTTWFTRTEDLTVTLVPGDTLEVWVKVEAGGILDIRNFRMCYTPVPATAVAEGNDP